MVFPQKSSNSSSSLKDPESVNMRQRTTTKKVSCNSDLLKKCHFSQRSCNPPISSYFNKIEYSLILAHCCPPWGIVFGGGLWVWEKQVFFLCCSVEYFCGELHSRLHRTWKVLLGIEFASRRATARFFSGFWHKLSFDYKAKSYFDILSWH